MHKDPPVPHTHTDNCFCLTFTIEENVLHLKLPELAVFCAHHGNVQKHVDQNQEHA